MAYKISTNAMKKLTIMMLLAAFFTLCVTSCSKDDDDSFAYPMEQLYGKWKAVEIKVDGRWYDVTKYPYTRFGMDITFYENGKFYGSGYLGNGSGTYTVSGKTITTYVSGKEYAVYTVNSLNGNEADLTLRMGGETLQMKAKKQY
jgi:hypothetical protein